MKTSTIVGWLAACLLSCTGRQLPSTRPSTFSIETHDVAMQWLPRDLEWSLVSRDPDGTLNAVLGGLRASLRGTGHVDIATQQAMARIVHASSVSGHWLFVTEDGLVLRSNSFTGTWVQTSSVPHSWRPSQLDVSHRLVLLSTNRDQAWTLRDDGAVQPLSLPDGHRFRSVALDSTGNGFAISELGWIWRIGFERDPVLLRPPSLIAPTGLSSSTSNLLVVSTGDSWIWDESVASLRPISTSSSAPSSTGHSLLPHETQRFRAALSFWTDALAATRIGSDRFLVDTDTSASDNSRFSAATRVRTPAGCLVHRWGLRLGATCPGVTNSLLAWTDEGFVPLPNSPRILAHDRVFWSSDGVHLLAFPGSSGRELPSVLLFDSSASNWRIITELPHGEPLALDGTSLLVRRSTSLFSIAQIDESTTRSISPPRSFDSVLVDGFQFGQIVGHGSLSTGESILVSRDRRVFSSVFQLPESPNSVSILDAQRMAFVGDRTHTLYLSTDSGAHWNPLVTLPSLPSDHFSDNLRCTDSVCSIEHRLGTWVVSLNHLGDVSRETIQNQTWVAEATDSNVERQEGKLELSCQTNEDLPGVRDFPAGDIVTPDISLNAGDVDSEIVMDIVSKSNGRHETQVRWKSVVGNQNGLGKSQMTDLRAVQEFLRNPNANLSLRMIKVGATGFFAWLCEGNANCRLLRGRNAGPIDDVTDFLIDSGSTIRESETALEHSLRGDTAVWSRTRTGGIGLYVEETNGLRAWVGSLQLHGGAIEILSPSLQSESHGYVGVGWEENQVRMLTLNRHTRSNLLVWNPTQWTFGTLARVPNPIPSQCDPNTKSQLEFGMSQMDVAVVIALSGSRPLDLIARPVFDLQPSGVCVRRLEIDGQQRSTTTALSLIASQSGRWTGTLRIGAERKQVVCQKDRGEFPLIQ